MPSTDQAHAAILADGRFPVGGHAHSAGFEAATTEFGVSTEIDVDLFLGGRLATTGASEAHQIALIRYRLDSGNIDWHEADIEIEARIASAALRATSRTLGRHWLRAARTVFPGSDIDGLAAATPQPHQVAAFAATTAQAGIMIDDALHIHLHHLVTAVTGAAVRLHGLDPFRAAALHRHHLPRCRRIVDAAMATADAEWRDLAAPAGPLTEILAEAHAVADGRLFRS